MHNKIESLIDAIFKKLKNHPSRKFNLSKEEFSKFIYYLINNNQ